MQQNRCSEQTGAADTEKFSPSACTSTATAVPVPLDRHQRGNLGLKPVAQHQGIFGRQVIGTCSFNIKR